MDRLKNLLLMYGFVWLASPVWAGLSPSAVMSKNEEARKISEMTADARMIQVSSGSGEKIKEFNWARKLASNQKDFKTFVRFTSPATIQGEGILILEHDGSSNEVLLYLPAFKKVRRVENQQQTGKFMGSEFSYSDIATPHVSDFLYSKGDWVPCPGDEKPIVKCYLIEAKPANQTVTDRTGYSKVINYIRSDNFMLVRAEYYDLGSQLIKRMDASQMTPVAKVVGKWIARKTVMNQLKTKAFSRIELSNIKVNTGIPDATFTQQYLSEPE